jgi:predicted AAA+ superfamily ATPase
MRGARQVGKTWLLREFGQREYGDVYYVNFDSNSEAGSIFDANISPRELLSQLELLRGQAITPETLLIFDEIQEVPRALTSLKYFCEEAPEYHVVCAGSLLGVALHQGTSFPVGKVDMLTLYPLTFTEFLMASGREQLIPPIEKRDFVVLRGVSSLYKAALKEYFLVGGMPEAVSDYIEHGDWKRVTTIQDAILTAYDHDISKHAPITHVPRIRWLWESIPRQLAKENKKFVYGQVREGARGRDYEMALMWLSDCGLIHRVNRVTTVLHPLKAYEDSSAFKIYLCDVGLFSRMAGLSEKYLLDDKLIFNEFKGAVTEQFVLQEIRGALGRHPLYWSNAAGQSEVEFLLQFDTHNVPVEVKAGINLRAKSLKTFMDKYRPEIAVRTSLADHKITPVEYNATERGVLVDIPLYAFSALPDVIAAVVDKS